MFKKTVIVILLFVTSNVSVLANNYRVELTDDSPIVKGGTIHFYATVYDGNEIALSEKFEYNWEDAAIPQHTKSTGLQNATDSWVVTYEAETYPMGTYIAQVQVRTCTMLIVCYEIGSARVSFKVTETLNGKLLFAQNNKTSNEDYVSNKNTVMHQVNIKQSDNNYISKAPTVLTYWFVDCIYYGFTSDFKFPFNYTNPDEEHFVEALVMADFTPLPPTTTASPSTTTTKPTSTIKPTTSITTIKPNSSTVTTTIKPTNTTTVISHMVKADASSKTNAIVKTLNKRSLSANTTNTVNVAKNVTSKIMVNVNGVLVPYNGSFPYVCNATHVATDSKLTYGYFFKTVKVKAPIAKVNVTGNNWIQHGDLLSLNVNCQGSKNIQYCVEYRKGAYNVSGNETCYEYLPLNNCEFSIKRYLQAPKYTILIIIKNEVSKIVQPVTVTFYDVITQGQLSVIVVPVAFSLVAVVLIVFGVAYYLQNRSRFVIEVADFNFGQQYSDLEYKTFRERLRDSIMNAFTRDPSPSSSEVPVWPPGRKYGSMT